MTGHMANDAKDNPNTIDPDQIRYIKLGEGGSWEAVSLDQERLYCGHASISHDLAHEGNWDGIRQLFVESGRNPGPATSFTNELKDFYTLDETCLWFTFARGRMWWTFAGSEVHWVGGGQEGEGPRYRNCIDGWSDRDIAGEPLIMDRLSTRLTQTAAYRQTICKTKEEAYLLRVINAQPNPVVSAVTDLKADLSRQLDVLIRQLHWADFEVLVDLIFARGGWDRVNDLGGTQKDTDLILEQPLTGERAFVQVKSKAGQSVLDDYVSRFEESGAFDRMFFVCHSPTGQLESDSTKPVHVLTNDALIHHAMRAGLVDWIIEKSA